ncbi:hypothetical protein [Nonomuraea ceibae]|uniref:hypothetical protein n=1 Tax=Nonomuraea ceibae TaxID=1935170 RepID=UPI001C5DD7F7|nr:hypothetical protein [Nonomuraea ceibae]
MNATTYVYGRQVNGASERFTILVAIVPTGLLLHLEHTRKHGPGSDLLLSRIAPLPTQQTVDAWLKEKDAELQASGWGMPTRVAGIC